MSFLVLLIFLCILGCNGVAGRKSFKTIYGDIYDCVDFYKQPSLDHPKLKNHNFHPQMKPSFLPKSTGKSTKKDVGCQIGTVPIKRVTRDTSKTEAFFEFKDPSGTYAAGVQTTEGYMWAGGGMAVTLYEPPFVLPKTYSQARIKISNGADEIQVGWRVDLSLRGDNLTRQYIYTKTEKSQCFDAKCGFVITNKDLPIDQVFRPSKPGGEIITDVFNITRDKANGNWWFVYGFEQVAIGFWPKNIFTGLGDFASKVEWAGEVYSPPGVDEPPMGSGYKPEVDDLRYVAFFANLTCITKYYDTIDNVFGLEEFATDRSLYDVKDKAFGGDRLGHYAFFGGARY